MAKFEKLEKVKTIKLNNNSIVIYKFIKTGTKRVFFAPEFNGKRLNSTLYQRLYDAEYLAKLFLKTL